MTVTIVVYKGLISVVYRMLNLINNNPEKFSI